MFSKEQFIDKEENVGNQYIDAIWLIPVILFTGWTCFVYLLGVEVGKARKEQSSRRSKVTQSNVRVIRGAQHPYYRSSSASDDNK